jgi:hypothetical protein
MRVRDAHSFASLTGTRVSMRSIAAYLGLADDRERDEDALYAVAD